MNLTKSLKKFFVIMLSIITIGLFALGFSACGKDPAEQPAEQPENNQSEQTQNQDSHTIIITAQDIADLLDGVTLPATYNGEAQPIDVEGAFNLLGENAQGISPSSVSVVGYRAKGSEDEFSQIAPTNAGEYEAKIHINAVENNNEEFTGTIGYTIAQKDVTLAWQQNTTFAYVFGTPRVPTLETSGIIAGDNCSVTKTLNGNNLEAGQTFTYSASLTGEDSTNYKLLNNVTSPEYYIEYGDLIQVNSDFSPYTEVTTSSQTGYYTDYFRVNLEADKTYYLDCSLGQDNEYSYYIYAKNTSNEWEEVVNGTLYESGGDRQTFDTTENKQYMVKIIQSNYNEIDNSETITLKEHAEHTDPDFYGFCEICGEYVGTTINFGEEQTLSLGVGQKAYYRFAYLSDYKLKREYKTPLQAGDFAFYYLDNNGVFQSATFDGTYQDHIASFDGYYYVVITATSAFNDGKFRILDEVNESTGKGVVPGSAYFVGDTYSSQSKEYDATNHVENMNSDEKVYLRFEIEQGATYSFSVNDNFYGGGSVATVRVFYYDANGTAQEVNSTNWSSITVSDDTYLYVRVYANQDDVSGGFKIIKVEE
ncbi:MAG: hypothetical protein IJ837_02600 [Clostridia bacterium]|nr:hypothetical protein [Clostridia bacterium]